MAVLLALGCLILSMVAFTFSNGFVPLAISTVLFAFGAAFPGVLVPILVIQMFGVRDFSTILGPAVAMLPAGVAVGAPLWGLAYDVTGSYTVALGAGGALTLLAAALLAWALRSASHLRDGVERDLGQGYASDDGGQPDD